MNGGLGRCLLDERLTEKGWSRQKLEAETGLDFRMISFWTTNSRAMSLKNAIIISNTIGCAVQDLYENGYLLTQVQRRK